MRKTEKKRLVILLKTGRRGMRTGNNVTKLTILNVVLQVSVLKMLLVLQIDGERVYDIGGFVKAKATMIEKVDEKRQRDKRGNTRKR